MGGLRSWGMLSVGALAVILLALPFVVKNSFAIDIFIRVLLFAFVGVAWNLIGGYAKQLSLGHAKVLKGLHDAGKAIGLTPAQRLLHVRLPTMFRVVLPALSNQFVSLFKDTSIAAVLAWMAFDADDLPWAPALVVLEIALLTAFSLATTREAARAARASAPEGPPGDPAGRRGSAGT